MKIERIETIYGPGSSGKEEDNYCRNHPLYVVVDGFSAPYNNERPSILFDGLTGGAMVSKTVVETFSAPGADSLSLEQLAIQANDKVRSIQEGQGIPIDRADLLAGAAFVFAKVGAKTVEIIQGADCLALWVYSSGHIGIINKNSVYKQDEEAYRIIAELRKKYNEKEMWVPFYPYLCELRLRYHNKIFPVLNGQPWFSDLWKTIEIPLYGLELLMLFSDGFVPFEETSEERINNLAERVVSLYQKGGLRAVLEETRTTQLNKKEERHIAFDEATALAIVFG